MPVIVFFDEMHSILRTRGSGVSSDLGEHDRASAAERDRRRGGSGEQCSRSSPRS
jgi:SpoVK/Ycf46/Vps4 family AAA+-type ATPase